MFKYLLFFVLMAETSPKNCTIKQAPYIVSIMTFTNESHYGMCAGVLISPEWIITAAHCVDQYSIHFRRVVAFAGSAKAITIKGDRRYQEMRIHHPPLGQVRLIIYGRPFFMFRYKKLNETRYDFAVMRTVSPFNMSDVVRLAHLPTSRGFYKGCTTATVYGWSNTFPTRKVRKKRLIYNPTKEPIAGYQHGADIDTNLQCVDLDIMPTEECKNVYKPKFFHLDRSVICTRESKKKPGRSACYGDSGAPLVCNDVVIGISSSGFKCGSVANGASLFTNIEFYYSFIEYETEINMPFKSQPSLKPPVKGFKYNV